MTDLRGTTLSQSVSIAASLLGAFPVLGVEIPFTYRVISTTAADAISVIATGLGGTGDVDVLSASWFDNKIAWNENGTGEGDADGAVNPVDSKFILPRFGYCD